MRVDFKGTRERVLIKKKKELDSTCLLWFVNISNFKISMPPGTQHEFKHRVKP